MKLWIKSWTLKLSILICWIYKWTQNIYFSLNRNKTCLLPSPHHHFNQQGNQFELDLNLNILKTQRYKTPKIYPRSNKSSIFSPLERVKPPKYSHEQILLLDSRTEANCLSSLLLNFFFLLLNFIFSKRKDGFSLEFICLWCGFQHLDFHSIATWHILHCKYLLNNMTDFSFF